MPLWMQLLISGGILQAPEQGGEGGAGGGAGGGADAGDTDDSKEANANDANKEDGSKEPGHQKDKDDGEGNKPKLTDKEAALLKEVMQRKESEQKIKLELEEIKSQLGDLDITKAKEVLAKQKDAETKELEAKGEYERIKQRMAQEHQTTVDTLNTKIKELQDQAKSQQQTINNLTVGAKFSQSKFITEELVLPTNKARTIYGEHFDIDDSGNVIAYDKPRGAENRTAIVDGYGANLDFDAAMRKIIEADPEKDYLIKSKMKIGSGSDNKGKPNAKNNSNGNENLSSQQKISAGLKDLLKSAN